MLTKEICKNCVKDYCNKELNGESSKINHLSYNFFKSHVEPSLHDLIKNFENNFIGNCNRGIQDCFSCPILNYKTISIYEDPPKECLFYLEHVLLKEKQS